VHLHTLTMSGEYLYCAAIDFGTTFTGLAYAKWNSNNCIPFVWEDGPQGALDTKTPTAVLFDAGQNFLAFGHDAKKKYDRMSDRQKWDCYYFEKFKMDLHQKEVRLGCKITVTIIMLG